MFHELSASSPIKLILKGTSRELASSTAKKILILAKHFTSIPVVCETVTSAECSQLSHLARSLVMLVVLRNSGNNADEIISVATSRAMMKTIASMAGNSAGQITASPVQLTGMSIVDDALVDGWLSFVWNAIDLPIHEYLLLSEDEALTTSPTAEKEGIEKDLKIALKKIEEHLSKQQFCCSSSSSYRHPSLIATVSSSATEFPYNLVDLSLAVSLRFMRDKNIAVTATAKEENPHLHAWKQGIHKALGAILETS